MKTSSVWLLELQNGKETGLNFYMAKYGHSLRFFAYSIVKDKGTAEEIVSDSFYKLWKGKEKVKTEDNLRAFLYLVTRNACYDFIDLSINKISHDSQSLDFLIHPDPNLDAQIIYNELLSAISKELEKLPETQAKIFRMSYLEGFNTNEICDLLNTTPSTVYFAKSKAVQTLKAIFKAKNLKYYSVLLLLL
ncbi:MAG: RNA polymerase sigma factor, partial [Sphingobacterium sp.]